MTVVIMVVRVEVRMERVALSYLASYPHVPFQKHLPRHRDNVAVLVTFPGTVALPSLREQLKG